MEQHLLQIARLCFGIVAHVCLQRVRTQSCHVLFEYLARPLVIETLAPVCEQNLWLA